jgi:hypothetical protein
VHYQLSHATFEICSHDIGIDVIECAPLASKCEEPGNHPRLRQYDPWCQRVDDIILPNEWKQLHDIAAREGLVAIGYERPHGEYSRLYQFAKQYLYMPFCANVSCPLSMTDGAARIIELLGTPEMKQTYYKKLTRYSSVLCLLSLFLASF